MIEEVGTLISTNSNLSSKVGYRYLESIVETNTMGLCHNAERLQTQAATQVSCLNTT